MRPEQNLLVAWDYMRFPLSDLISHRTRIEKRKELNALENQNAIPVKRGDGYVLEKKKEGSLVIQLSNM